MDSNELKPCPLFTCHGKGGEYIKLGYAKPAGAIKTIQGDSGLIVYQDTQSGQLYFRDPADFRQRMTPLDTLEPCILGGDAIRQLVWPDDALDAMRERVEAAELYAARYRWLCDRFGESKSSASRAVLDSLRLWEADEVDDLDKIVADAMRAEKEAEQ